MLLLSLMSGQAGAQTIIESANGESSVVLHSGSLAMINFADASVKAGLTRLVSTTPWRFGLEAKVKGTDGFIALVGGSSPLEADARLFVGYQWNKGAHSLQWMTAEIALNQATFSLARTQPAVQRFDTLFRGATLTLYHNVFLSGSDTASIGDFLAGIAAGFGTRNNYASGELSKVTVCSDVVVGSGPSPSSIMKCRDARLGQYVAMDGWHASADVLFYPRVLRSRIALDLMARYNDVGQAHPFTPAVGLFVPKSKSPRDILGGFTVAWPVDQRPIVGFQTGLIF